MFFSKNFAFKFQRTGSLIIFLFLSLAALSTRSTAFSQETTHILERRAAIDIGSGSIKMKVADVDIQTQRIAQEILTVQVPLSFQKLLEKNGGSSFDGFAWEKGVETIEALKAEGLKAGATKIHAVATAAFRQAANGREMADAITEQTDVPIDIIDQQEEGALGYLSAISKFEYNGDAPLVVWDIGGGSLQFIQSENGDDIQVQRGRIASIGFKNLVMTDVKHLDPEGQTPLYPMSLDEIQLALKFAEEIGNSFTLPLDAIILGIGSIHNRSLGPNIADGSVYTKEALEQFVFSLAGKDTMEIPGDPAFADTQLTNAILVLGIINAMSIAEVNLVDATMADAILIQPKFWE